MASKKDSPAKRRIRSAAISLFKRKGEAGLTMRGIANAVGVSATSLYRHYRDRGALLADVYRSMVSMLERELAMLDRELKASERVREVFITYFDWGLLYPEVFDLSFARHRTAGADGSDDVHVLHQALGDALTTQFDACLAMTVGAVVLFHTRPTDETVDHARERYSQLISRMISA